MFNRIEDLMKPFLRSTYLGLAALLLALLASPTLSAQQRDSVQVLQTPGGNYLCCYDLSVTNRQTDSTVRISEFSLTIISGRAAFVEGISDSPPNWTIFQTATSVKWTANTAAADITRGENERGFRVCVQDTGIFRVVWETRNLDSVISRDTLAFACRGIDCDEAFFRIQPSNTVCIADIDVVAGNGTGRLINDFHLHLLTPGVSFSTAASRIPEGWVRLKAKADTLTYFTSNGGLDFNEFIEGLRIEMLGAQRDSTIKVEWWTTNFGDRICVDTAVFTCGLAVSDSVTGTRLGAGDSCCQNIRLKNTHAPGSPIDGFAIKITSAGGKFLAQPSAPSGWSSSALNAAADSVNFKKTNGGGLPTGDTTLFAGVCFTNALATSDTIRYRWYTYSNGVPITSGNGSFICIRPLTSCDSVTARVDSTFPATQRCVSLTLRNRNSRKTPITRFVARIANPGTPRTIVSATAPSPWRVESFGGDSVVYSSGQIVAGGAAGPFVICTSMGDSLTRDPLTITWQTANGLGPICSDQLSVNAIITNNCDSVRGNEIDPVDDNTCCFRLSVLNRNGKNRPIDGFRLDVASSQQVIFTSATPPPSWNLTTTALPSFDLEFAGGPVAAGDSTPDFTFCLDVQQLPTKPAVIPVVWRTFSGGSLVCVDTVRLVCTGTGANACDTVQLISYNDSQEEGCRLGFRVVNRHSPAGDVDGLRLSIIGGTGVFVAANAVGDAASWGTIDRQRQSVLFRGGTLASGDTVDTFRVRIDSSDGTNLTIEGCTLDGDEVICCSQRTIQCNTAEVDLSFEPTGFRLHENTPNPFTATTEIAYDMLRAESVTLYIRDQAGRELRRFEQGRQGPGSYRVRVDLADLPSGVYYYTLKTGTELQTRRMVLVR